MEDEEYEDYLVDRAKEILNEEVTEADGGLDTPDVPDKKDVAGDGVKDSSAGDIPFSWDPREVKHLTENRTKMSNRDLKKFFERDSKFHEMMEEVGEWRGFSRWEERLMVQKHTSSTPEELAEELDRGAKEVELKMHMMGLIQND